MSLTLGFLLINPRKGTETRLEEESLESDYKRFLLINPRKGTETHRQLY